MYVKAALQPVAVKTVKSCRTDMLGDQKSLFRRRRGKSAAEISVGSREREDSPGATAEEMFSDRKSDSSCEPALRDSESGGYIV